ARIERALSSAPNAPTLRDVQHALAIEHGYAGWTALTDRLRADGDATEEGIREYELMAEALLDAYRTGTPEAMERHYHYTWHRRAWQGMRTYVQVDLGIPASPDVDITLDDARFLVAREHGYADWVALLKDVATRPIEEQMLVKPMSVFNTPSPKEDDRRFTSKSWNALLAALPAATGIDAHGGMTDALLEDVAKFKNLTMLRCGGSQAVTDEGIRHLAHMPNLRHLDLSGTAITDRGLSVLRELKALEHVSLSWTRASDAGVAHLSLHDRLQHVNISGTACGDGSIRALTNKAELSHFMSGNATTDAGLSALHDFPVFKTWQGGDPRDFILGYDSRPNLLMLRGAITRGALSQLRGLDGVFGLDLDDSALPLDGHSLEPIVELPNLAWLGFDAKDDAMPYIARMVRLRGLACQDTPASDVGWTALSTSQSIERIWARRCHNLRNTGFRALSTMPSLRSWAGSCKNVDDSALAAFPSFPALNELMPMDVPDASYRHIAKCAGLETLTLMYCRDTTDAATQHIATMTTLTKYFASYTQITDRTPELLSHVDSLEHITFDSCAGLTNAGIATLARLPQLRELHVSGRGLTADVRVLFPGGVSVRYSL
ncbi:MAG: hypothetical protein H7Z40_15600, partial [Phycisphaerae bacterium]|nr:hypothetical protein [Gemmatimonadaceae bacterium]